MKSADLQEYFRESADLFERIRSASDSLTPSFRRVAEYIVGRTQDVAFSPAARVAAAAGVSESVVVRFAGELGYSGYPAMQQAAQAFVRSQLLSPAARLEALSITSSSTGEEIFRAVLLKDVENLHTTAEHVPNHAAFERTVDILLKAQRLYVLGFRGLRHLAELTAFLLDMASLETVPITEGDAAGFQILSRIRSEDALLAFAFARYTRATRAMVEIAGQREAATVVICDTVLAPAARKADVVLQAATASSGFHNSYTAAVACVNALILAVSTRMRARVAERLRQVDEVLPAGYFDIE